MAKVKVTLTFEVEVSELELVPSHQPPAARTESDWGTLPSVNGDDWGSLPGYKRND